MIRLLALLSALVVLLTPIQASNLLTNGSFNDPPTNGDPSLPPGSTYLTAWTVFNAEIAQIHPGNGFGITSVDDGYSLDLTGYHDSPPPGGVTQNIATVTGATYSISFYVGAIAGLSMVNISAGNLNDDGGSVSGDGSEVWTQYTNTFQAVSTTTNIQLLGITASDLGRYLGLDAVDVEFVSGPPTATPEPVSALLFGCGALVLAWKRRRPSSGKKNVSLPPQ